jgi:hypothetical protein
MWDEHALSCLDENCSLLKAELKIVVAKHFERFAASQLESCVKYVMTPP